MGEFFFPTANSASTAPEVEDGLALARFEDLKLVDHPDWAGTDQYGNADDGRRYHFVFALVDEKGEPIYDVNSGDPVELERLTRTATGKRSKFREVMEGLLTPAEFTQFLAATADNPFNGEKVKGRVYNIKVGHSASGWPNVEDVIGVAKGVK